MRIFADENGKSAFEDVDVQGTPTVTVEGVPPLLVSGPFPAASMLVVEQPSGGTPERREFGALRSFEDTEGEGHLSTPLTDDLSYAMFPHQPA